MASKKSENSFSQAPQLASSSSRWQSLAGAGIVIVAGLLAYHNSFNGPFIFDDKTSIVENSHIRQLWPISKAATAPPQESSAGRPIVCLSLALNYSISGLNVWSYHVFNLAVHILAGLALFGVIRRTLLSEGLRKRFGRVSLTLALVCSLIWVVHPLQTESVTYIIQRAESLMGLFYLLSLYCAIRGFASAHGRWWYTAVVVACALGMGTKEVMATAPLIVLLYDRAFVARSFKQVFIRRWGLYAGMAATWLILGALVYGGPRSETAGFGLPQLTTLGYAMTQCKVIVFYYLKLSFWPHPLVFDYGWPIVSEFADFAPFAAVLAALLVGTLAALRYRPRLGFLGAWFFLILAPSSSFLTIITEIAAEHRMYLSLAAVITVVVVYGYSIGKGLLARLVVSDNRRTVLEWSIGYAMAGAVVIILCFLTIERNLDYRSDLSIWQDTVLERPDNFRAYGNRGIAYGTSGKYDQAIQDFDTALALNPKHSKTYNNRGSTYCMKGNFRRGIQDFDMALKLDPDNVTAYNNRKNAYRKIGAHSRGVRNRPKLYKAKEPYRESFSPEGVNSPQPK